jgi:transposase
MQGKKDYQEKLFIRFQLSDYVPQDNFYRQLKSILDFSFLYASTSKYYGTEGQKSIDPVVFMKLMLVGYLENLNSDRRIITTSRMRMDILYFIGYDLDEELPWHSTLSRTRQLYGEEQFLTLFKVVLKQCIAKGLVSGKRQAIDSVFVKANAAMSSMVSREILEDATTYSKELESNSGEQDAPTAEKGLKKDQPSKKQHTGDKPAKRTNKTHVSPSDPDARMSYKPGKVTKLNYLGQVSVDTAHHVITHIQAFHADQGDNQCLAEVLTNTIENLRESALEIEEVIADAGYSSGPALQALADNNIDGYIPNAAGYLPDRKGFTYDQANDSYICSQGIRLTLRAIKAKYSSFHKIYKSRTKDCKSCPLLDTCANPAGIKSLEDSISKPLYDQMHLRIKTNKGSTMRRLRSSTVEPVIGTLVNFTAMGQVYTKGISLANKCMIMAAVAYNLKKMNKETSGEITRKIRKPVHSGFNGLKDSLAAWKMIIYVLVTSFKTNDKNKWLNNHLLCKLNYSATIN